MIDFNKFIISFLMVSIGQAGSWFQLYGHIRFPFLKDNLWFVLGLAIPLTWIYWKSTALAIEAFGGQTWPVRFVGFSSGIIVFFLMSRYMLGEQIGLKNVVCLFLCLLIILIQVYWK